jgi:enamine deaminase RidA (YjgF/YER057c/UK114 family)
MGDFVPFNGVYAKHMGDHTPARSTVEVARLPKDVLVEVSQLRPMLQVDATGLTSLCFQIECIARSN